MEQDLKQVLGQIIDNQFALNKKMDNLINEVVQLKSIFIKYDNDYQNEIAEEAMKMVKE